MYGIFHPKVFFILDGINLAFHEAGHPIFGLFGSPFLQFLGGTLMQLLIPTVVMFSFFRRGDHFAVSVILFWIGENFCHISPYIKDARSQVLPLVGGGIHDWWYILGRLDLLIHDQFIGNFCFGIGSVVMLMSVILGFIFAKQNHEENAESKFLRENT